MRRLLQMLLIIVNVFSAAGIAAAQGSWDIILDAPDAAIITDIDVDHDGNLWLATSNTGVYRYDGTLWRLFTVEDGLKTLTVYSIAIDPTGDIWFMTRYGLNFLNGDTWEFFPYNESGIGRQSSEFILGNYKSSMSVDNNGTVWCAFYSSIESFKDGVWKRYGIIDGLPSDSFIKCKLPNGSGKQVCVSLWGLGEGNKVTEGAYMLNGDTWELAREITRFGTAEMPNLFSTLAYSPEGELWGTYRWTFYQFIETAWQPVYSGSHLGENILTGESGMTVDTENNPWVNSQNGISVYDGTTLKEYTAADGYAAGNIIVMTAGKDGEVWLLTEGGLSRFTPGDVSVESPRPKSFALNGNYPNPFNGSTTINYTIPNLSIVTLSVYNCMGQKIRSLHSGLQAAGSHTAVWNGTNDHGESVSSGIYFSRLETNDIKLTRRMMYLK